MADARDTPDADPPPASSSPPRYWAFISYSRSDERWARWIHRSLERFRVPEALRRRDPSIPKHLRPIFRDRDELAASSSLSASIVEALQASRWLIVICSRSASRSRWVEDEIVHFARHAGRSRILCVIVDGEPNATSLGRSADECFPPSLRRETGAAALGAKGAEPLGVDVRRRGDSRSDAILRLVSGLIGASFDDLKRRDLRRRRRRRRALALAALAASICVSGGYVLVADAGAPVPGGEWMRRVLDRGEWSVVRPAPPMHEIRASAAESRVRLLARALEKMREGGWRVESDRDAAEPKLDVWVAGQAAAAVLRTPELSPADGHACLAELAKAFDESLLVRHRDLFLGWTPSRESYAQAEPALWLVIAISQALARPGLLTGEERQIWIDRLVMAQTATEHYARTDGSWCCVGGETLPERPSTYTTALSLLAHVESERCGHPWRGRLQDPGSHANQTAEWLLGSFEPGIEPPGWRGTVRTQVAHSNEGLTLQIYLGLMHRQMTMDRDLPPEIRLAIRERLIALADGDARSRRGLIRTNYRFRDHRGAERDEYVSLQTLVRPWAIATAAVWLRSTEYEAAAPEERVRVRRTLGRLIDSLRVEGPAPSTPGKFNYVEAESLLALSFVEER